MGVLEATLGTYVGAMLWTLVGLMTIAVPKGTNLPPVAGDLGWLLLGPAVGTLGFAWWILPPGRCSGSCSNAGS